MRHDRSRDRRYRNRMGKGVEEDDEEEPEVYSIHSSDEDEERSLSDTSTAKAPTNAPAKAKASAKASKAEAPVVPERTIIERTRIQCMKKMYDDATSPNTKKHCKKLFEGIVANHPVITTAVRDLGSMDILSQDIVERTKMFIPPTPSNKQD